MPLYNPPLAQNFSTNSTKVGDTVATSATNATLLGFVAKVTQNFGTAIGADAQVTGTTGTAMGYASRATSGGCTAVGYACTATNTSAAAYGNSANALGASSVAFGQGSSVAGTETGGTAVGAGATITAGATGGGENTAIGGSAIVSEWRATAVGYGAWATAISATAIGRKARSAFTHAIALGRGSYAGAANTVNLGFSGGNVATDVWVECGFQHKFVDADGATITRVPTSTPIIIHGFDAFDATDGLAVNVAGGPLQLAAGVGTGTAASGTVDIRTAPVSGVSSNTKNTLVTAGQFDANTTASETRFLLYDVTAAALVRVSRGASDSGGAGFRLLRIPN